MLYPAHRFYYVLDILIKNRYNVLLCRHTSESGLCVKAKIENNVAVWAKTECDDSTTKGVVCARRFNWEDIGKFRHIENIQAMRLFNRAEVCIQ